jgi:hypothetical protein
MNLLKHYSLIPATPLWINVIEYGLIGLIFAAIFNEFERPVINYIRLSVYLFIAISLFVAMFLISRKFSKPKNELGLFIYEDKFIYSPTNSFSIKADWANVERIEKKEQGVSNYIIPIFKNTDEVKIMKKGWFQKRNIQRNMRRFGMPLAIEPYSIGTSVYELYDTFTKQL